MRKRALVLLFTCSAVLLIAACGRASEDEINDLLGIQPTPTLSDEQMATATAFVQQQASAIAAGATPVEVASTGFDASAGDVTLGRQQFQFQCQQCHRPDGAGTGPALAGPDNPAVALSDQDIYVLVREGHATVNPVAETRLSDRQLAAIIAFIRQQSQ